MTDGTDGPHGAGGADSGRSPPPRIEILSGGDLGSRELVALAMALRPRETRPDTGAEPSRAARPAWQRAAVLEALGGGPLDSPQQLHARERQLEW